MSLDSHPQQTRAAQPRSRQELVAGLLGGALALVVAGAAIGLGQVVAAWTMVVVAVLHLGIRTVRARRLDDWHG